MTHVNQMIQKPFSHAPPQIQEHVITEIRKPENSGHKKPQASLLGVFHHGIVRLPNPPAEAATSCYPDSLVSNAQAHPPPRTLSLASVARELLRADVVIVDSRFIQYFTHRMHHGPWAGDVVNGERQVANGFQKHGFGDESGLSMPRAA
jgi:hypothetical protein